MTAKDVVASTESLVEITAGRTHTSTRTHAHTRAQTHTHEHAHKRTHAHMHTRTHAHTHTRKHAHTQTRTHANTYIHTHTTDKDLVKQGSVCKQFGTVVCMCVCVRVCFKVKLFQNEVAKVMWHVPLLFHSFPRVMTSVLLLLLSNFWLNYLCDVTSSFFSLLSFSHRYHFACKRC